MKLNGWQIFTLSLTGVEALLISQISWICSILLLIFGASFVIMFFRKDIGFER